MCLIAQTWAASAAPQRTFYRLTTGNGHGFQIYDVNSRKIVAFLEHPYRYLRPRPDPRSDGVGRRNLAFDLYFGVRVGGTSGWLHEATPAGDPGYVEETNIIRAPMSLGGVTAESYFFAPFGYEGNALVALLKAPGAREGYVLFNFHMGGGSPDSPDANGESLRSFPAEQAVAELGPGGGAMVYVALSGLDRADCQNVYAKVRAGQGLGDNRTCAGDDVVPAFQRALGPDGWMAVAVLYVEDPAKAQAAAQGIRAWAAGRSPEQILRDALAEWEQWRRPPPAGVNLSPLERRVWRQSEAVQRMGQVREPYTEWRKNNGMILASLPPGEWHSGWVRDAMYSIVAFARAGYHTEARMGLDFLLDADPVGKYRSYVSNVDYRISVVRYFGSGEEEADYSGEPTPNIEVDGWGMMMWAARQYVDASGDVAWLLKKTKRGPVVYDVLARGVADALAQHREPNGIIKADSSIWEVHEERKKHFAYTTMAAIRGFCDMATLALRAGRMADVEKYRKISQEVEAGFYASFLDRNGAIAGSVEELAMNQYLDAAVVEAFTWNILPDFKGRIAQATLDLLRQLRVESGGFKRNDDGRSSYDDNEWILIDLRMADAMWRAGRGAEADQLVANIVEKAAVNFNLLPELYNAVQRDGAIGRYAGSIPMVGYGGGAFMLTMLDRAGLIEPSDCGASVLLPDGGIQVMDGGARTGGGGPGGMVPRTTACLCQLGAAEAPAPGTAVLLALPWILVGTRLVRVQRHRRGA